MSPAGRRLLYLCLFLSGGASLVLEVAWSRDLSLALGNSHQAVATVVASMMAGLFLGSLAASRSLSRLGPLPRAYGLVEMGVGSYAALTPLLFHLLPLLLGPLYTLPTPAFLLLRFLLVFILLLPPSAGMGATLPIVTAALARREGTGRSEEAGSIGGRLYGLNTLGAFLGTLAGGFLLLPGLGLLKTTLLGASTSLGVGTTVWLLSDTLLRQRGGPPAATREEAPVDRTAAWVLPLYAASGCVAMIYEITWTRALAPVAGASVYSFTLILAAILAGIGLGSLVLSSRRSARTDPAKGFAAGQILLAFAAFGSTWGLKVFPDLMLLAASRNSSRPAVFLAWQFLLFGFIVLLPAMILGALFPFASRLLSRLEREAGAEVGRVYAWNTAGSIVGSLAAGFYLVETLGSEATLVLACAASASLGLAGLALASGRWFRPVTGVVGALFALSIPFLIPTWDLYRMTSGVTQVLRNLRGQSPDIPLSNLIAGARAPDARVVFHREGKTSTVTVIREWNTTWLRVDGKTDASSTADDMLTQVLLGQLPFTFARNTADACVIGYGSGVTSHAVLTHPVRLLDTIEIEQAVIDASPFFESVNFKPMEDRRSRVIVDDARTALAYRPQDYDIIISEPSNPWMAGVNNLFTSEFYSLVRKRLKPGGIFCQWVQSYEMSSRSLRTILDTLATSFPHVHLFSSLLAGDLILIASDRPLEVAPDAARFFPDRPLATADLARVYVRNLEDIAILYTGPIQPPPRGTLLNTDDNSLIQYRAPLELLRGVEPSLGMFTTSRSELERLFFPGMSERDALVKLGKAADRRGGLATLDVIISLLEEKGYEAEGKDLRDRAELLKKNLDIDRQVNGLLLLADARGKAKDIDGAVTALKQAQDLGIRGPEQNSRAGFVLLNVGRYEQAEAYLDRAAADPSSPIYYQALAARGATRYRLGKRADGVSDILAAKTIDPGEPLAYLLFGMALFDAGEKEAALQELQAGLTVAPEDERLASMLQYFSSLPGPVPVSREPSP